MQSWSPSFLNAMHDFDIYFHKSGKNFLFHLPSSATSQSIQVHLYNAIGEIIHQKKYTANPLTFNTESFKSGTYFIELIWMTQKGLRKESLRIEV